MESKKDKRVAIVTGSASGIGAATAVELSRRGFSVLVNYSKSKEQAEGVAAKCKDAIVVQADVGDDAQCRKLAQAAMDKWGRIDALVNNAGTTKFVKHADLDGLSADDFLRIYRLNVVGPFQMVRACAAALKDFARPEDIADTIAWLIEGARQTTGETIFADGGMHIATPR